MQESKKNICEYTILGEGGEASLEGSGNYLATVTKVQHVSVKYTFKYTVIIIASNAYS